MSFYIYLDSNGNEVKREQKGRGRVKRDATQGKDGNWYIKEGSSNQSSSANQISNTNKEVKVEEVEIEEEVDEKPSKKFKIFEEKEPMQLDHFLKSIFYNEAKFQRTDEYIEIGSSVIIKSNNELEHLIFSAAYGKLLINLGSGSIQVWRIDPSLPKPDFEVRNAIAV